jgi:hypothetical protein
MITLNDKANSSIKRVTFTYDTYTSNSTPQAVLYENDDLYPWNFSNLNLRLRYFLKSISTSVLSGPSADSKNYNFSYINPQDLPNRLSFSQDEGGYFNGISNTWFIPRARVEAYIATHTTLSNFPLSFTGYRNPTLSATAGILNKITYPTGGVDSITYELNSYTNGNGEEIALPGLRVYRINSSSLNSSTTVKTFNYKKFLRTNTVLDYTPETSSNYLDEGNPFVEIDNPFIRRFVAIIYYQNPDPPSGLDLITGFYNMSYHNFSSNSRYNLNVFHGNPIAYTCVTETQNSAFTASKFDVSIDEPGWLAYGDEIFMTPKENTAWNNGLELYRYYGTTSNDYDLLDENNIIKEMSWVYNTTTSSLAENRIF